VRPVGWAIVGCAALTVVACSQSTPVEAVELVATTSVGDQPWTDRLLPPQTPVTVPDGPPDTALPDGATPVVTGDRGGLYGGSLERPLCDTTRLADTLEGDPAKLNAWSGAQGVSDARGFIASLTPVLLRADIRVTSYGYEDGRALPHEAVLESGTIVLIDEYGEPKVRCAHGDPLDAPSNGESADPDAVPWPGFDVNRVMQVRPALGPMGAVTVVDLTTGALTTVPVGSGAPPGTATTSPSTTPETTNAPVEAAPRRALADTPVAPAPPPPAPAPAPPPPAPEPPPPEPAPAPVQVPQPQPVAPPPEIRVEVPGLPPLVIPLPN
jgi:hypothetical protein